MNGLKRTPAQIKERQQLCRDLSDIIHIHEDGESLLETVLDEYIYKCNEDECEELRSILRNDYGDVTEAQTYE